MGCKNAHMLTHAGVFSVDFSRIDTGKTVCFLVSGGLWVLLFFDSLDSYPNIPVRGLRLMQQRRAGIQKPPHLLRAPPDIQPRLHQLLQLRPA